MYMTVEKVELSKRYWDTEGRTLPIEWKVVVEAHPPEMPPKVITIWLLVKDIDRFGHVRTWATNLFDARHAQFVMKDEQCVKEIVRKIEFAWAGLIVDECKGNPYDYRGKRRGGVI